MRESGGEISGGEPQCQHSFLSKGLTSYLRKTPEPSSVSGGEGRRASVYTNTPPLRQLTKVRGEHFAQRSHGRQDSFPITSITSAKYTHMWVPLLPDGPSFQKPLVTIHCHHPSHEPASPLVVSSTEDLKMSQPFDFLLKPLTHLSWSPSLIPPCI